MSQVIANIARRPGKGRILSLIQGILMSNAGLNPNVGTVDTIEHALGPLVNTGPNRAQRRAAFAQATSRKHLRKRPSLLQRKMTHHCDTLQVGQMKTLGFLKRAVPDLDAGPAGQLALASR